MSDTATGVRFLADHIAARMLDASVLERVVIVLVATTLALLIGAVIIAASGYDAVEFVSSLVYGAVGNASNLTFMPQQSPMLTLMGVAVAVTSCAGMFNIGAQGQFVVGGFAATLGILFAVPLLSNSPVSAIPLLALATLLALTASGAYRTLPGVMKAYAGANEVITTIMLNFIASGVVYFLLGTYLRPEGAVTPNTEQFPDYVGLPGLVFESPSFSILGLDVALLTVIAVYLVMNRTGFGYDPVTSDYQEPAARYSGIDPKRVIVRTMTISGMIAGLASALFVIMILSYYSDPNMFLTLGFDTIAVSLLAANNPLDVVPTGLLSDGLGAGGQYIGFTLDVPSELVDGVIGLIVLFVVAPELFRATGQHTSLGGDRK